MKDQLLDFTGLTELVNQMKGYTSDITSSIHLTGGNSNGTLGLDINGTVHYASVKGLSSAAYKATGSASGNIPVNGASLGSTANVPLVTNSNGQIVPHANGILGTAAFKNATEFATAAQGAKAETAVQSVSLESGTNKGTLKLTVNGKASDNIAVKGLGTAAYTASSAYATSSQGTKADNAMPRTGGTFTGSVTLNGDPSSPFHPATKQYVDSHIADGIAASDAMVFRGTLGTDGTVTALPDKAIMGDTYKVITVLWSSIFVTLVAKKYHESVTLPSGLRMVYDNH